LNPQLFSDGRLFSAGQGVFMVAGFVKCLKRSYMKKSSATISLNA